MFCNYRGVPSRPTLLSLIYWGIANWNKQMFTIEWEDQNRTIFSKNGGYLYLGNDEEFLFNFSGFTSQFPIMKI